jgi:hypothetical protein
VHSHFSNLFLQLLILHVSEWSLCIASVSSAVYNTGMSSLFYYVLYCTTANTVLQQVKEPKQRITKDGIAVRSFMQTVLSCKEHYLIYV